MSASTIEVTATVGGRAVPIRECRWYRVEPCGCSSAATLASSGYGPAILSEEEALADLYEDSDPALLTRDRAAGVRVELGLTSEVVDRMSGTCPHTPTYGRAPSRPLVDGYVWALGDHFTASRATKLHLVPEDLVNQDGWRDPFPDTLCSSAPAGAAKKRYVTKPGYLAGRAACSRCLRAAEARA